MSLELVSLKNNLLVDSNRADIKSKIINRLNSLQLNITNYKKDNEFLLLVCNLVEHLCNKKDKIGKQDFVVEIYNDLFQLTDNEKDLLRKSIDFLHVNKAIKKISWYRLFKTSFREWFKKKT